MEHTDYTIASVNTVYITVVYSADFSKVSTIVTAHEYSPTDIGYSDTHNTIPLGVYVKKKAVQIATCLNFERSEVELSSSHMHVLGILLE